MGKTHCTHYIHSSMTQGNSCTHTHTHTHTLYYLSLGGLSSFIRGTNINNLPTMSSVHFEDDLVPVNDIMEGWPARLGVELSFRRKQRIAAHHTVVHTLIFCGNKLSWVRAAQRNHQTLRQLTNLQYWYRSTHHHAVTVIAQINISLQIILVKNISV